MHVMPLVAIATSFSPANTTIVRYTVRAASASRAPPPVGKVGCMDDSSFFDELALHADYIVANGVSQLSTRISLLK